MSDKISIKIQSRDVIGKGLSKLKAAGQVPAVVHNHGKDSLHVSGDYIELQKLYSRAGKHHPVEISLDGKNYLALIKDVDFEPTKNRMRHVVFQAIKQNEKTTADIPVVLVGEEIQAEKKGLLILTQLDTVEVEALPKNLPDQLTVDATTLEEVGDRLSVADITVPDGVTILTEPEQSLAVVEMPKDQIAEADAAAASLAEDSGVPEEQEAPAEDSTAEESSEEPKTE